MDERLFGAKDRGWRIFDKCVGMLEIIAQEIADCFPEKVDEFKENDTALINLLAL